MRAYVCDACGGTFKVEQGKANGVPIVVVELHYRSLDGRKRFKVEQLGHLCTECVESGTRLGVAPR